jgi:hypothetical protein
MSGLSHTSGGGSGGFVDQRQSLIDQINSNTDLSPSQKQGFLNQAMNLNSAGVNTSTGLNDYNTSITDLTNSYNTAAASASKQLATTKAALNAQYTALTQTPGSAQTTRLTALLPGSAVPGATMSGV